MPRYNHQKVEKKWQKEWEDQGVDNAVDGSSRPKFYCLIEFPYPSGDGLHVGHVRSITAMDIIARTKRMTGHNVLYPIGWDAFGLPTENFAIKTGQHPSKVTKDNVATFKRQIKSLGISFDWQREINTTDPKYYKWTQWIFLKLFERGLAYKSKMPINWCPKCKIGLANEESANGKCERCGTETEKREIEQWMLKITAYADRLIEDLETVEYLEKIKTQQINWIGRSTGAEVKFAIDNFDYSVTVFTTRPDTLFGATFLVLSPEHELVNKIMTKEQESAVIKYQESARKKTDLERTELQKDKTGVFTGVYAINPVNNTKIPIWIADYVLSSYGTGAIMAVPAHDERDYAFAKKYELPIVEVVVKKFGENKVNSVNRNGVAGVVLNADSKVLVLYNKKFDMYCLPAGGYKDGEDDLAALRREIEEESGYTNIKFGDFLGTIEANFDLLEKPDVRRNKLQKGYLVYLMGDEIGAMDKEGEEIFEKRWMSFNEAMVSFSQNKESWGEEDFIARAFDKKLRCFSGEGMVINSGEFTGLTTAECQEKIIVWLEKENKGKKAINYHLRDWVFSRQHYWGEPIPMIYCDKCKWVPLEEKDLPLELPMVEKYEPTTTGESPLAAITDWVNVKCPKCGGQARRETDTMPNWAGSSWYFLRYIDPANAETLGDMKKLKYWMPVDLYNGGMEHTTLHLLYSRFWNKFLYDIGAVPTSEPYTKRISHGMILAPDGQKMSKSRGNVINPDEIVEEYGADVLRLYEMFMGPYDQAVSWDLNGVRGIRRFIDKLTQFDNWLLKDPIDVTISLHKTIKKVTDDIAERRFNTAVSAMMIFVNGIEVNGCTKDTFRQFLLLLFPFAPHVAEELNHDLGGATMLCVSSWPDYNPGLTVDSEVDLIIQVNGKVRAKLRVSPEISEQDIIELALRDEKVKKFLNGASPKKTIYVKGKLLSLVV